MCVRLVSVDFSLKRCEFVFAYVKIPIFIADIWAIGISKMLHMSVGISGKCTMMLHLVKSSTFQINCIIYQRDKCFSCSVSFSDAEPVVIRATGQLKTVNCTLNKISVPA